MLKILQRFRHSFLRSCYTRTCRRAQAEIDQAIGWSRLPAFSDHPDLPNYVDGIYKGLLRWWLVLSLSVAHATAEDDVYIPKGMTVLVNTWAILHDAEAYPEPEEFKPESFLTEDWKVRDDLLVYAAERASDVTWSIRRCESSL